MAKIVVGKTDDIGEGKLTHVQAGGKEVLVANVKGNYYAMGNICTHA
ncbi:MAG: Rieske 2Fe-2S domain-containing protein, partial [Thermoproteota archaeon]|nr:Rieske 2Fe-2S domain-containing protein [Thermoproteota archaeon]